MTKSSNRHLNPNLIWLLTITLVSSCSQQPKEHSSRGNTIQVVELSTNQDDLMMPPIAKKQAHKMTIHGDERIDNYYWMRDDERKRPEVIAHLNSENEYTQKMMAHTQSFQEKLYQEIVGRIPKNEDTVPVKIGKYWYFERFIPGQEYAQHVRKSDADSEPTVILDENNLAKEHTFYSLSAAKISTNGNLLAFSSDIIGRRLYQIQVKDLSTGIVLQDQVPNTTGNIVWANDNASFFYVRRDLDTLLGYQVYVHRLGQDSTDDQLIYEETDITFFTSLEKSIDLSTVFINHDHTIKTGVSSIDANASQFSATLLHPIEDDIEYEVNRLDDRYFIRTNWQAKNFRIMHVAAKDIADRKKWEDLVAPKEGSYIGQWEVFNSHLVYKKRENAYVKLMVKDLRSGEEQEITFNDPVFELDLIDNIDPSNAFLRLVYSSMTTPETSYDIDLKSFEKSTLKQQRILGNFDPKNYRSERISIRSRDGVKIPVSIVYHKDKFKKNASNPILIYGYGSYGANIEPGFRSDRLSLLDRGFAYVIAHIRGSQTLGRTWYEDGKMFNKLNTFNDFVDVTKALIELDYAHPDKLFAAGGSAGGLLMGAVINQAPELYRAVYAAVPFVDVVTTMLDESIPLTTNEWDEWGNPNNQASYDYMLSYSPYDQVRAQNYPNLLVTAGLHDSQVQYFEPAKWVAKLRELKTNDNQLLFDIDMEAGHGGASGRYKRYRQRALEYAFFFDQIGIKI